MQVIKTAKCTTAQLLHILVDQTACRVSLPLPHLKLHILQGTLMNPELSKTAENSSPLYHPTAAEAIVNLSADPSFLAFANCRVLMPMAPP